MVAHWSSAVFNRRLSFFLASSPDEECRRPSRRPRLRARCAGRNETERHMPDRISISCTYLLSLSQWCTATYSVWWTPSTGVACATSRGRSSPASDTWRRGSGKRSRSFVHTRHRQNRVRVVVVVVVDDDAHTNGVPFFCVVGEMCVDGGSTSVRSSATCGSRTSFSATTMWTCACSFPRTSRIAMPISHPWPRKFDGVAAPD
jgi:hypothetical protein